jgi:hypothetical protein
MMVYAGGVAGGVAGGTRTRTWSNECSFYATCVETLNPKP